MIVVAVCTSLYCDMNELRFMTILILLFLVFICDPQKSVQEGIRFWSERRGGGQVLEKSIEKTRKTTAHLSLDQSTINALETNRIKHITNSIKLLVYYESEGYVKIFNIRILLIDELVTK